MFAVGFGVYSGYTIDKENNTVIVTADHFSTITVAGVKATAPSKAKNLQVKKITDSTAKLTWKAPSSGEVTKTNKVIKKLLAETRYQFRVAACNGTECSDYTDWKAFKTK